MKKRNLFFSALALIAMLFAAQESKSQGINYELEYSVQATSNGVFIVSTCNCNSGNACNMPGSIHRNDISALLAAIRMI